MSTHSTSNDMVPHTLFTTPLLIYIYTYAMLYCVYYYLFVFETKGQYNQRQNELKPRKRVHTEGRQGPSGVKHCHVRSNNNRPPPRTTHRTHQAKDHLHPTGQGQPPSHHDNPQQRAWPPIYIAFSSSTQNVNCASYNPRFCQNLGAWPPQRSC